MSLQAVQISITDQKRRSSDHFAYTVLSVATQAITVPLTCIHRSLVGQYTYKQDFVSRYQWTIHHVRTLHQWITAPEFWIKWTQIGEELYLQIHHEHYE